MECLICQKPMKKEDTYICIYLPDGHKYEYESTTYKCKKDKVLIIKRD